MGLVEVLKLGNGSITKPKWSSILKSKLEYYLNYFPSTKSWVEREPNAKTDTRSTAASNQKLFYIARNRYQLLREIVELPIAII